MTTAKIDKPCAKVVMAYVKIDKPCAKVDNAYAPVKQALNKNLKTK